MVVAPAILITTNNLTDYLLHVVINGKTCKLLIQKLIIEDMIIIDQEDTDNSIIPRVARQMYNLVKVSPKWLLFHLTTLFS